MGAVTVYPCVVMFASYAWLFSKLYFDAKKPKGKKKQAEGVLRSISRAVSVAVLDAENSVDANESDKMCEGEDAVASTVPKVTADDEAFRHIAVAFAFATSCPVHAR